MCNSIISPTIELEFLVLFTKVKRGWLSLYGLPVHALHLYVDLAVFDMIKFSHQMKLQDRAAELRFRQHKQTAVGGGDSRPAGLVSMYAVRWILPSPCSFSLSMVAFSGKGNPCYKKIFYKIRDDFVTHTITHFRSSCEPSQGLQ